jgi:diguanylate cyclase (GGDEF)-like protein
MAYAMAVLFLAGGAIGAISLLLPHPASFNEPALWTNVGVAFATALLLAILAGRLPPWTLHLLLAAGTIVVTRAIYYSGANGGFYTYFYVWVGLYAFFFFGRFWGALHMLLVGATYAWVLDQGALSSPVGRWLTTVGTIAIGGFFVESLAARVRAAAANAESRARALAAVDEVAHQLAHSATPHEAANSVCKAVMGAAQASGAMLWQPNADGTGLECAAATDTGMIGQKLMFVGPPSGAVTSFTTGERIFVPDAGTDQRVNKQIVERFVAASVLFEPVQVERTPIAVLTVLWQTPVPSLEEEVVQTVGLLAAEASFAMERAELLERLERAARTDDLTGLLNRRAWDEYLEREIARARRSDTPLCVVMLDLDHFKEYNDRNGHQAGDRLLKQAAARWQVALRATDLLARYGGDEFAIALIDCGPEEAAALLERLRAATPQPCRCSAGVVSWDGSEDGTELIARADRALYAAKNAGRDRVVGD